MRDILRKPFWLVLLFFPLMLSCGLDDKDESHEEDPSGDKRIICSFLFSLFSMYKELSVKETQTERKMDVLRYEWYQDIENKEKKDEYYASVREHREAEWDYYILRDVPVSFRVKINEICTSKLLEKLLSSGDCEKRIKDILTEGKPGGVLEKALRSTILQNFVFRNLRIDTRRKTRSFDISHQNSDEVRQVRKRASCDFVRVCKREHPEVAQKTKMPALNYGKHQKEALFKSRFLLDQFPQIRNHFFAQKTFESKKFKGHIQKLKGEHYFIGA